MIAFSCSQCQTRLKVKDELAGKRIRCPHCQQVQEVPLASEGAATVARRAAAHSRTQGRVAEDATLPPSRSSADEATIPPSASSPLGPTITYQASDHEPAAPETREVVKGGFAYEVEDEIARGGMGAVMRAVDQDIRREVAVKFLLNHADESLKTRFIEEAQITGQLEHPNIVPIHQLGVHEDGRCFFSMKMVKGRSLADILKDQGEPGASATGGEFTLGRLLNIFSNICNALAYAHSRQVIHRDLKPANIMVGDFGEVYVMDWGLAKVLGKESGVRGQESGAKKPTPFSPGSKNRAVQGPAVATGRAVDSNLTQAGAIMGTPAYMPPEQAAGEAGAVDERSDIYSLGAILYEILTLSPPVGRGGDQLAVLMRVLDGAITPPEKQAPERARQGLIPPELSAVALKALAKDPVDRYQTVEELQHDIQLFLEGRSVSAKRDSAWELFKKLVRRNKGVSLATTAALMVLIAGAALSFYLINRERREAVAARDNAQDNYKAFKEEQEKRMQQGRDSIPSLLTAGKLLLEKRDFEGARAQVRVALGFDSEHPELRYLNGQLAMVAEDFAQAQKDLEFYARQRPGDQLAGDLLAFLPKATAKDTNTRVLLAEICTRHLAYPLADGALKALGENAPAVRQKLLTLYQKRLGQAWPGKGTHLTLDSGSGTFHLNLVYTKEVTDLSPLRSLPLTSLNLQGCEQVGDLEPLKGMPLTSLNLYNCREVRDLTPLKDMPLTSLNLQFCPMRDLGPLKDMRLTWLNLSACVHVHDLEPLKGMPLTYLDIGDCPKVRDLAPLRGLKLSTLHLYNSYVNDLGPLKGMKLTSLDLRACSQVRDLGPLKGMPLTSLILGGCGQVRDLEPLTGMPLQNLFVELSGVADLTPLQGMKLKSISLTPKTIAQGLDFLRRMESLKTIRVSPRALMPAAEFWKKHDAGEFKK